MGKKRKLEHKQNKFEQHIEINEKRIAKKVQNVTLTTNTQPTKPPTKPQPHLANKKNLFALDSEDEQVELKTWKLTHNGQDLQEDYNDQVALSSEEDLPKGFVKANHFVGFDQNQEKRKSKKEIYDEIIQSSKQRKAEKQKLKEDNQTKLLYLNETLPQILDLLPVKQKYVPPVAADYAELMESFKAQPKVQLETVVQSSEKSQLNYMKQRREELRSKKREAEKKQIEQDSEEESEQNDDCVSKKVTNEREKKMLKSYKKVEHMQRVMEHLRNVQNRKQSRAQGQATINEDEDSEVDDDEDLEEVLSDSVDEEFGDDDDDDEEDDDDNDEENSEEDVDEDSQNEDSEQK